ncbi:MAG: threonine--tRNA ligase [Patescibacteria group bacterium]
MSEDAEKSNDHKRLGHELDLFAFSDTVGKGLPLWTSKGATVRRELERFIVDEEIKRGYLHVYTPDIAKLDLYKKSGHYPHYQDSMYAPIEIDKEKFMLRPMTCPHHFELYLRKPWSYRELPVRMAELAKLYRYEQSGELMGLQRVRTFCLADAHIICKNEEEAVDEMGRALDLIEYANGVLGLEMGKDYHYRLSLGDRNNIEKYYKDDKGWDKAEDLLRKLMDGRGVKYVEGKNEAAFYGPKIDIQMKNANGKEDTAFTVQYDLSSPEKFNLVYIGEDGKEHRAFVVHRSSIGSIERTMSFLIEKYAGAFPLWLSPTQVRILPISEKHLEYAKSVYEEFRKENIRTEIDESNETLGKKIRNGKTEKIPYLLVIGDKEIESETVSVESRDEGQLGAQKLEGLISKLKKEISEKKSGKK